MYSHVYEAYMYYVSAIDHHFGGFNPKTWVFSVKHGQCVARYAEYFLVSNHHPSLSFVQGYTTKLLPVSWLTMEHSDKTKILLGFPSSSQLGLRKMIGETTNLCSFHSLLWKITIKIIGCHRYIIQLNWPGHPCFIDMQQKWPEENQPAVKSASLGHQRRGCGRSSAHLECAGLEADLGEWNDYQHLPTSCCFWIIDE